MFHVEHTYRTSKLPLEMILPVDSQPNSTVTPWHRYRGVVAVICAALAAHIQAIGCGWIWDDDSYVTANRVIQSPSGLLALWWPGATPQYYPLVFLGFWIEHALVGLEPLWFHLTNVFMHATNAMLLAVVLRRLHVPHALWIAALFATHPMGVESVAWITERKNVQSMLFALLSIRAFLPILEQRQGRPTASWVLSFLFFIAALLSKTTAVFVAPCLVMLVLWKGRSIDRRLALALTPYFAVGLALGLLTAKLEQTHVGAVGSDFTLSWFDRVQLAGLTTSFYIQAFVLPIEQIFIYPRFEPNAAIASQWLPFTTCTVLLILALAKWRSRRAPLLLVLWLGAGLFPALGFFDVWPFRFSYVADHFAYAAMPCLATIATVLAVRAAALLQFGGQVKRTLGVLTLCILVVLSNRAIPKYESEETLWTDTLARNPQAWIAANNLASIRLAQARDAMEMGDAPAVDARAREALEFASRAGAIKPTEFTNAVNRSEAHRLLGRTQEALSEIEYAATLAPQSSDVQWIRGRALTLVDRNGEARDAFRLAADLARNPAEEILARRELMRLAVAIHAYGEAADACARIVALTPQDADMTANLGSLLLAAGRSEAGRQALLRAARFDASRFSSPETWIRVSLRYLRLAAESKMGSSEASAARALAARVVAASNADPAARYLQLAVELALGDSAAYEEIDAIGRRAREAGNSELADDIERLLTRYRPAQGGTQ